MADLDPIEDLLALLTSGTKARVAMEVAIAEGYVRDPERMRRFYDENQEVLEAWVDDVSVAAVVRDIPEGGGAATADSDAVTTATVSAAVGSAFTYILSQ